MNRLEVVESSGMIVGLVVERRESLGMRIVVEVEVEVLVVVHSCSVVDSSWC